MKATALMALLVGLLFFLLSLDLPATELVYTPINPSFGGSSFNAAWMQQQAEAQNTFTAPQASRDIFGRDPLETFTETLNRQILSRLASQLTRDVFGESQLEPGHYEIGNFIIDVSEGTDGIHISVFDSQTGNETNIVVPFF